ncbi:MAG: cation:proton antiporter [Gammaproteobacteria bacterium]|nr:cation:proton antiporter [Gammaproteobacteria bacterium]
MTATIWLTFAFFIGLLVRQAGLPPLVGYLIAGFILSYQGHTGNEVLYQVAHAGVLVLLFSVGLKLKIKSLFNMEVLGGSILHMLLITLLLALVTFQVFDLNLQSGAILAIALAFSSTVVAAKILEERRELRAFHGRVAIGILIMQDLAAVAVLSMLGGHSPSPWAFILIAFFILRPLIHKLLDLSGHDELLILYGLLLALAVGGKSFEYFGLSSELGALLLGVILADHKRATELSNAIWGLKEVLLVGFFLQIGLTGHPDLETLAIAAGLTLLLPIKGILFFFILLMFRLRARTAFLTGLSLATFSEFGLIIANMAVENDLLPNEWLVTLAVTVAFSFAISAPLNRYSHYFFKWLEPWLLKFESKKRHPDDMPISIDNADMVIIGMGRVGTRAYDYLHERGYKISAMDSDPVKAEKHKQEGRNVIYADADDPGLWEKLKLDGIDTVLMSIPDLYSKRFAIRQLRSSGYKGMISTTAVFEEEVEVLKGCGADHVYNYFNEVGVSFAEHLLSDIHGMKKSET